MLLNVYLPDKKGTLSFEVNLEKSTEFAKYAEFRESSFCVLAIVKIMRK